MKKKKTDVERDEVPFSRGIRNYPNASETTVDADYTESEQELVGRKDRYDEVGHKILDSGSQYEKY